MRPIANSLPQALLETKSGFIGTTDTNWSGYYIEFARNGEKKFWIFDEKRRDVPAEFLPLLDEIQKPIRLLNAQ
ncbi:hypothetical protein [Pontibacter flavimaris]|uniref:Uncharacterized protein n=1 Tax=Pontibacter flavimaris TaxID=1797110 RepID=A0A1Q5PG23_9BACT|nr:hypothetical protein [Pontibacter flavimaris]OKL41092.1 hypothetical protein A3841_14805 [Pontibacter flavimaris]